MQETDNDRGWFHSSNPGKEKPKAVDSEEEHLRKLGIGVWPTQTLSAEELKKRYPRGATKDLGIIDDKT